MSKTLSFEVGIATATLYPTWSSGTSSDGGVDKVRGDLALQLIDAAIEKGYQIVIVDGGSSQEFKQALKDKVQHVYDQDEPGMSAGRRQAFSTVSQLSGVSVVCWTEPEKVSMVRDCLQIAATPVLNGEADIVVPSRDAASFATYPNYQVDFEVGVDRDWNRIVRDSGLMSETQDELDVCIGPRIIWNDPVILRYFMNRYRYKDIAEKESNTLELWPNALFTPLIHALKDGVKVVSIPVPYRHPEVQTHLESDSEQFRQKRAFQRQVLLEGAEAFIDYLQKVQDDPSVIIEAY